MNPNGAVISPCETYRYLLWRDVGTGEGVVVFIMLNPSTADADVDDPTIRRCIGFARAWGYGYLTVVNLFALRSTNPAGLAFDDDPIGPQTNPHIEAACGGSNLVVCAWGVYGNLLKPGRDREVVKMLRAKLPETRLHHLGLTKHGHPRHPLYLRADATPILWEACNG